MTNKPKLFDKAIVFTDLHVGKKNNSKVHNDDCEQYIEWMINEATGRGIKTCIFMGDWHDSRHSINVSTLNYTVRALKRLNDTFDDVYMLVGNHDLYFREKRELNSLPMADTYENITVISDDIWVKDDVAIVPWLVGEEWRQLKNINAKFVFGHFELPSFYMNALVQMPDTGSGFSQDDLDKFEHVFSGHFHKRQARGNVVYPGNCFPHNYADAWDDERGCMILDWEGNYETIDWPDCPKYRTTTLSRLIDEPSAVLGEKTHCKVMLDLPISYEEAALIKDTFADEYNLREITLVPMKRETDENQWKDVGDIDIMNVDQIVFSQLSAIESNTINNTLLLDIYNNLQRGG